MANNIRAIRKRILSIMNTQQIMKAMKMVAAAKLRRAQEKAVGSRPYLESMTEILGVLLRNQKEKASDLLIKREEEKKIAVLLYTSNRGLCGSFNNNLIRFAEKIINDIKSEGKQAQLFHIGRRGYLYFKKRNYNIAKNYEDIKAAITLDQVTEVTNDIVKGYLKGEFDRCIVVYSKFHSAATSRPLSFSLLPVEVEEAESEPLVIFEPNSKELLDSLLPEYIRSKILNAMLESYASEQGARMTAMESASTNAGDMLKAISLEMNKARQALITQELVEITSSSEAVKAKN